MDQKTERTDDHGILAVGVDSVARATEKTLGEYFAVLRDARVEITQRVTGAIDWVDGGQQGLLRLARSIVKRLDDVAGTWTDAQEHLALGVLRALRTTSEGATHFASRTAATLTSTRRDGAVAQA
ncbi:MAG TPA: hypothetical protein VKU41_19790 [Polyangiaceae bacterium]|nr:hypothetical protein [Polyangiaceae bacterium]